MEFRRRIFFYLATLLKVEQTKPQISYKNVEGVRILRDIITQLTTGDIIGLSMIMIGICLCVVGVTWVVKSRCQSLTGPMVLCWVAALFAQIGTVIARFL